MRIRTQRRSIAACCGRLLAVVVVVSTTAMLTAAGAGPRITSSREAASQGRSLKVLENAAVYGEWPGLDPATDHSDLANFNYLNAIHGGLFEQGKGGQIIPDLATGYKVLDGGKTVDLYLRQGVRFQDGTTFDAQAVASNIRRDLDPVYSCRCLPNFPVASIATPGPYTVQLQLTGVFAPIIYAFCAFFDEAPNWIVSPTALAKMGEQALALKPVGAGPFEVESDEPNSQLVLKANPDYWQKGHPHLKSITFSTVGSDESA